MLARAFKDEFKEIFPNPVERVVKEPVVNEFYLQRDYSYSKVFITSTRLEGLALWMHSNEWKINTFWRMLTSGAIWLVFKIGIVPFRKLQAADRYIQRKHKELIPQEHWYLEILAVDPEHQGKGYSSKLMNEMLRYIDEECLPCYLETDGSKNISIYEHFGFKVVDEFVVPNINEKVVAMIRRPK